MLKKNIIICNISIFIYIYKNMSETKPLIPYNYKKPKKMIRKKQKNSWGVFITLIVIVALLSVGVLIVGSIYLNKTNHTVDELKNNKKVIFKTDFDDIEFQTQCSSESSLTIFAGFGPLIQQDVLPFSSFFGDDEEIVDYCVGVKQENGIFSITNGNTTAINPNSFQFGFQHQLIFGPKPGEILVLEGVVSSEFKLGDHPFDTELIHPEGPRVDIRLSQVGIIYGGLDYQTEGCKKGCILTMCLFQSAGATWAFYDSVKLDPSSPQKPWAHFRKLKSHNTKHPITFRLEHNKSKRTYEWFIDGKSYLVVDNLGFMMEKKKNDIVLEGPGEEIKLNPNSGTVFIIGGSGASGAGRGSLIGLPSAKGLEEIPGTPYTVFPTQWDKPTPQVNFDRKGTINIDKLEIYLKSEK